MSIVHLNQGAQFELPSEYYSQLDQESLFTDFGTNTPEGFTATSGPVLDVSHGSALLLDAADEIETKVPLLFVCAAGKNFSGASRTKLVFGSSDVTSQGIGFGDSSVIPGSLTEALGFNLVTDDSDGVVVNILHDDGTADNGVALAASELPNGSSFDFTAYHEYGVAVDVDINGAMTARFFIDGKMVKKIDTAAVANWAATGLVWQQTNLTGSSTVDQAIDWISVGTSSRL
jgi:hypothetical protein